MLIGYRLEAILSLYLGIFLEISDRYRIEVCDCLISATNSALISAAILAANLVANLNSNWPKIRSHFKPFLVFIWEFS